MLRGKIQAAVFIRLCTVTVLSFAWLLISSVVAQAVPVPTVQFVDPPESAVIGSDIELTLTFNNTGTTAGYAPYIDLYLPAKGVDGNTNNGPCDGISFVSAKAVFSSPSSLNLKVFNANGQAGQFTGPNILPVGPTCTNPWPNATSFQAHPLSGAPPPTILFGATPAGPQGYERVVIELPFSSFQPAQGQVTVTLTVHLSDHADTPDTTSQAKLSIFARGGFRYAGLAPILPFVEGPLVSTGITPYVLILSKTCQRPNGAECAENETATGPSFPFQYVVNVDVATDVEISHLLVTDHLDNNLQFDKLIGVAALDNHALSTVDSTPSTSIPGGDLGISFTPFTGTDDHNDLTITLQTHIPQFHADGSHILNPKTCKPQKAINDVIATGEWKPIDPRDWTSPTDPWVSFVSDDTEEDHILAKKCIALQKSVSGNTGVPGDTLTYALSFQVSDFFAFNNTRIIDVLSDGQTWQNGSAGLTIISANGNTISIPISPAFTPLPCIPLNPPPPGGAPSMKTQLTFNISAALAASGLSPILLNGTTGTITFKSKIDDKFSCPVAGNANVDKHDWLFNHATIFGEEAKPVQGPVAKDSSGARVDIPGGPLKKCVLEIDRNGTSVLTPPGHCDPNFNALAAPQIAPGDVVKFQITKDLPSGDWENMKVEDFLPLPVFHTATSNPATAAVCGALSTPILGTPTGSNSLVWDFGSGLDVNNNPCQIKVLIKSLVSGDPYPDGLIFNNEVIECEGNSFSTNKRFCQIAIANIELTEPDLKITKGIVAACQPDGSGCTAVFGPNSPYNLPGSVPPFNPTITSATGLSAPVNTIDGGDNVTFAIVVENTGSGLNGAFDVQINDIIDSDLGANSNLSARDGAGMVFLCSTAAPGPGSPCVAPANMAALFSPAGIYLDDPGPTISPPGALDPFSLTTGQNIAVLTYDVQIKKDVIIGKCYENIASILNYAGIEGGPNHVTAGFGDQTRFTSSAEICIKPSITKSIVKTSEAHTTGSDLAIGEIVRYRLQIKLPEGAAPGFHVQDHLPVGLKFVPGSAKTVFVSSNNGITSTLHPTIPNVDLPVNSVVPTYLLPPQNSGVGCNATNLDFDFGKLFNTDADVDAEFVIIEFNAQVCNIPGNVSGNTLNNNASVLIDIDNDGVSNSIDTSNTVAVTIVEPNVTIEKTAEKHSKNPNIITYTLTLTNTGNADAFDVFTRDKLPACLQYQQPVYVSSPGASTQIQPSSNTLSVKIPVIPAGDTVTIKYKVASKCSTKQCPIINKATVSWTSLPGLKGTVSNPTGSQLPNTSGHPYGERNGSIVYAPFPPTSPLIFNPYHVGTSVNLCGKICVRKLKHPSGNLLSGWDISIHNIPPTTTSPLPSSLTSSDKGPVCTSVLPGTYQVSETLQPGWTATTPPTVNIDIDPGEVENVTFENEHKILSKLDVTKVFINQTPIGVNADFDISVSCTNPATTLSNTYSYPIGSPPLQTYTYGPIQVSGTGTDCSVSETPPPIPAGVCKFPLVAQWQTSYSPAQPVSSSASGVFPAVTVRNILRCEKVTPGKSELKVRKIFVNKSHGTVNGNFNISVNCTNPAQSGLSHVYSLPAMPPGGGVGQTYTFSPILYAGTNTDCTVSEAPPPIPKGACKAPLVGQWHTSYTPNQTVSPSSAGVFPAVTVENTLICKKVKPTGSLTVTKKVVDMTGVANPDLSRQFDFAVSCNSGPVTPSNFSLTGGNSITISPIPAGAACTVTELAASVQVLQAGCKLISHNVSAAWFPNQNQLSTSIPANGTAHLEFTNNLVCLTTGPAGSLKIQKKVSVPPGMSYSGLNFPIDVTCTPNVQTTINLPANGSLTHTLYNIPVQSQCFIQEDTQNLGSLNGCKGKTVWTTTYSNGQNITINLGSQYVVVHNTATCEGPKICVGGQTVAGKCQCPKNWTQIKTGPNKFRCIKPAPVCTGGQVSKGKCYCPKGWKQIQTGPNKFRCLKPAPPVCTGGKVAKGKCYCPRGWKQIKTGPNKFRCLKPAPPVCTGGKVAKGKCYCPRGWKQIKTGPNKFRCLKPAPVCIGGKTVKGKCYCPRGLKQIRIGPNQIKCVK